MGDLSAIVSHFDLAAITGDLWQYVQEIVPSTLAAASVDSGVNRLASPRVQSVFNMSPTTAMYTYGALAFVWPAFAFAVWYRLHDTNVDDY